jgi:alpha-tubulin suppressor-like RCC1 family protein
MGNKLVNIYCWGKNNSGELSTGNNENYFTPTLNKNTKVKKS